MSLYIPTHEERKIAKEVRSDIFEAVMKIENPKSLKQIRAVIMAFMGYDCKDMILQLDEFVDYLDLPMVVRLKDLFKDEDPWLTTKKQIDELCTRAIESYAGADHCE